MTVPPKTPSRRGAGEAQRILALFPRPRPATPRGGALWDCLRTRCLRSWVRPGAYAWQVLDGQLEGQQRALAALRRGA
jgi:hypothetical protein